MGLFKKEDCALCGAKTGMLDKKIADGKVCKECSKKLSPWFDSYKESNSEDLEYQIKARETDLALASRLNFNKIFGEFGVILIDEEAKKFVAVRETSTSLFGNQKSVSCFDDVKEFAPDLIDFDMIRDVEIDIIENSREEKRMVDGNQESYDPPVFTYMYNFNLVIKLNHPYINQLYLQLNEGTVQIRNEGRRKWTDPGRRLAAHLLDLPGLIIEDQPAFYNNDSLVDWFYHSPYEMPAYSYGFAVTHGNWPDIQKYQYYLFMAQEIQKTIQPED